MSQTVGHLDFFPNGGVEMPGCQKNILSQIVDIDGIWEGKSIVHTDFHHEMFLIAKFASYFGIVQSSYIFFNIKGLLLCP